MSQTSLPAFVIGLNALCAILDKAEDFAKAKKIDSTVLTAWRLERVRLFPIHAGFPNGRNNAILLL